MVRWIGSIFFVAALATAAALPAGAGSAAAPLSTPELKQIIGSGNKNTVVFFLNPSGGPCRAQNEILQKLLKDRKNNFNVAYVSVTQAENQRAFYDYGVRSLPTLVLVDSKGMIARVFPPGIQSDETLGTALDGIK
jgi:thioredoxin 1